MQGHHGQGQTATNSYRSYQPGRCSAETCVPSTACFGLPAQPRSGTARDVSAHRAALLLPGLPLCQDTLCHLDAKRLSSLLICFPAM